MTVLNRFTRSALLVMLMLGIYLAGCTSVLDRPGILTGTARPAATATPLLLPAATAEPTHPQPPTATLASTATLTAVPSLANQVVEIPAPALAGNLIGDSTVQPLRVLLPPSYDSGARRYPVVYLLPGFGGSAVNDEYFPPATIAEMDAQGAIKEMILVVVNGENRLGGSFYVNSPVTGNWEDFVTQDVIRYVDEHYRTIPRPDGRGLTGHSMGGFGALLLGMRHPDLFGSVYAMSPGLFDENGLADSHMFSPPNKTNAFLRAQAELQTLPVESAINKMAKAEGPLGFTFAYGAAFAPKPELGPPYFTYPYQKKNNELTRDEVAWQTWDTGFGKLAEKVLLYQDNLRKLNGIAIDYGQQDAFAWIPRGCEYLSDRLEETQIAHSLLSYEGTHNNKIQERILGAVLPFFSERLADPETIQQ